MITLSPDLVKLPELPELKISSRDNTIISLIVLLEFVIGKCVSYLSSIFPFFIICNYILNNDIGVIYFSVFSFLLYLEKVFTGFKYGLTNKEFSFLTAWSTLLYFLIAIIQVNISIAFDIILNEKQLVGDFMRIILWIKLGVANLGSIIYMLLLRKFYYDQTELGNTRLRYHREIMRKIHGQNFSNYKVVITDVEEYQPID